MTSIKIALGGLAEERRPRRPRFPLLLRLRARLGAAGLDRRLAAGESIRESRLLRERAIRSTTERSRRSLARGLELAVRETRPGARRRIVPVDRQAVREARQDMESLAARLLDGEEVSPRGVALVRLLLTDGAGPLYVAGGQSVLAEVVGEARRALDRR